MVHLCAKVRLLTAIATVGFRRTLERSSGPILIYYDGYYLWANSVVFVIPSVYDGSYLCSIAEQWDPWNADVQATEMRCKGFRLAACGILSSVLFTRLGCCNAM